MTDAEIIEKLAREVMGWKWRRTPDPLYGHFCWAEPRPDDPTKMWEVRGKDWNPLESIADAWMIVEKMADHHKDSFRLHSFGGKESQANFKFGGSSAIGAYTKADTAPRAICLAALASITKAKETESRPSDPKPPA